MISIGDEFGALDFPEPTGSPTVAPPPFPAMWTPEHLTVSVDAGPAHSGRAPMVVAKPAAPWDGCPTCRGTGDTVEDRGGYSYAVPCRCRALRRWATAIDRIRLPAAFMGATADAWRPSPGWPQASSLRAYVDSWEPCAPGRVYCGANGIGKSWLMATLAWELVARPLPSRIVVRWVDWTALLDELRDAITTRRGELDIIGPLLACDVLCVDEIGHGARTEWADLALERIVGRRIADGGTTFATTNALEVDLPRVLGGRVYSRLVGRCELRTMAGPHRRGPVGAV